jgi:hypothetical protein
VTARITSQRLNRSIARVTQALTSTQVGIAPARVDFATLERVPPPVERYLRRVLRDGQPVIAVARFDQAGELRTDPGSSRWLRFKARQLAAPLAPGFVWDARVRLSLLHVRVHDAYVHGVGSGWVSFLSAIVLGGDSGRPELNSGALHRYLAEAVWYPTALLPSHALRWSPISNTKALATLEDRGISVSLEFWFNDSDEVAGIYSSGRWGRFAGQYRQVPWEGHFREYQRNAGMLVPSPGEVGWYVGGKWQGVWKGNLVKAVYELAQ